MIINNKKLLVFVLFCFYLFTNSVVFASEKTLIEGFAQWQASRIEKIILDEAIQDIAEHKYVKRFFPQTSTNIQLYESVSSKRLIPLVQFYIREDLKLIKTLSTCLKDNVDYFFTETISLDDRSEKAKIVYNAIKLLASKPKADASEVYSVSNFSSNNCTLDRTALNLIDSGKLSDKELLRIAIALANNIKTPGGASKLWQSPQSIPEEVIELLSKEQAIKTFVNTINEFNKLSKDDTKFIVKVHHLIQVIEYFGISEEDYSGFRAFKNTGLFLASLADAADSGSPDAVVATLDSLVDEQDVYFKKYSDDAYYSEFEVVTTDATGKLSTTDYSSTCTGWSILPCKNSLFISSYYGLSYGWLTDENGENRKHSGRAFGPVGVELKLLTYKKNIFSFNLAPLDLGNYISNELKEEDYNASLEDILAPSAFFSFSLKSKPIAFLIGYQEDIKMDETTIKKGPFLAIMFDLPIFTLY